MASIRYSAPDYVVEDGFWEALAQRKLNVLKLSEQPVPVVGWLTPGADRPTLKLTTDSLCDNVTSTCARRLVGLGLNTVSGYVIVFNTQERFNGADKPGALGHAAARILRAFAADCVDPHAWQPFLLIVYADIRARCFTFMGGAPAIVALTPDGSARDVLSPMLQRNVTIPAPEVPHEPLETPLSEEQIETISEQARQAGYASEPVLVAIAQPAQPAHPPRQSRIGRMISSALSRVPAPEAETEQAARCVFCVMRLDELERRHAWRPSGAPSSTGCGAASHLPLSDAVFLLRDGLSEVGSGRGRMHGDAESLRLGWPARNAVTALGVRYGLRHLRLLLVRPTERIVTVPEYSSDSSNDFFGDGRCSPSDSRRSRMVVRDECVRYVEMSLSPPPLTGASAAADACDGDGGMGASTGGMAATAIPAHPPIRSPRSLRSQSGNGDIGACGLFAGRGPWEIQPGGVAVAQPSQPAPRYRQRPSLQLTLPPTAQLPPLPPLPRPSPPGASSLPQHLTAVGWQLGGPRSVSIAPPSDPATLSRDACGLNLALMRWRMLPELDLPALSGLRVLLLGSGTLGCHIARDLLAWGVQTFTFVDSGRVAYSNPVRQPLFEFADASAPGGGKMKAAAAAEALGRIHPGVTAVGIEMSIPMPGHPVPPGEDSATMASVARLEALMLGHDLTLLLTDTRESRWLPTLIAASHGLPAVTVGLAFDSLLVMRHGIRDVTTAAAAAAAAAIAGLLPSASPEAQQQPHLSCYFCGGIDAPVNSTRNRSLDQQCTVTRPGAAPLASAIAAELIVSLLHHPLRFGVPSVESDDGPSPAAAAAATAAEAEGADPAEASDSGAAAAAAGPSPLGAVPQQVRLFLPSFAPVLGGSPASRHCTACGDGVVAAYRSLGYGFLRDVFNAPAQARFLEHVAGVPAVAESAVRRRDMPPQAQRLAGPIPPSAAGATGAPPEVTVPEVAGAGDAGDHAYEGLEGIIADADRDVRTAVVEELDFEEL